MASTPFGQLESGYKGNVESMAEFLRCWMGEVGNDSKQGSNSSDDVQLGGWSLPASVVHFHIAASRVGFKSLYDLHHGTTRFVAPKSARLFSEYSPEDFKVWKAAYAGVSIPDSTYYRYDKTQASGGRLRGEYLDSMLVVGAEHGGAYFVLNTNEKSRDGEYEAQILHYGGLIVRFKSFAHLLAHLYLEEREKFGGRDASLGHLYYYPGQLSETCARHILVFS